MIPQRKPSAAAPCAAMFRCCPCSMWPPPALRCESLRPETLPRRAAPSGDERLPGVAGPFPGAEVCEACEPSDDDGVYASVRSGGGSEVATAHMLAARPRGASIQ